MSTMALVSGELGYAATRVDDVLEWTGMSRRTFYAYFSNREQCFFATYDAIVDDVVALLDAGGGGDAGIGDDARSSGGARARDGARRSGGARTGDGARAGDEVELEQVLESLLDYAAQWPAHARVLLIEVQSAGPAGVERHEATMGMLAGRLSQCDQWRPGRCRDLGREEMGQAVVGAIARMVQARLISTGNGTVAGLLPSVVALTTRVAVEA